jgi:hypothetical protein
MQALEAFEGALQEVFGPPKDYDNLVELVE